VEQAVRELLPHFAVTQHHKQPGQQWLAQEWTHMNGSGDSENTPTIRIFPDFGGFTHRIVYPTDHARFPDKYPRGNDLVPIYLDKKLDAWQREFEKCAFDDWHRQKFGTMLWISFDLAGVEIAKQIKKHVNNKARVLYLKPVESPYCKYDTAREVLASGELVTLNYRVGWHNLVASSGQD
jgi:hypothetical protein